MCGDLQSRCLGLLRSDYILDVCNSTTVKQVEMNTIASSFAGLTSSAPTHRYITSVELGLTCHIIFLLLKTILVMRYLQPTIFSSYKLWDHKLDQGQRSNVTLSTLIT